ncbi:MAG: gliding motility-associated C-terminal domain-containing protein [Bacteroidales bacterium]|nr:gliding motility-associated C-terminal domain-containing protein [Bacteroidales bacterium]
MRKVIFTILSVLLSVVATCQDIYFEIKRVDSSNLNPKIYNVKKLNGEPINEELKIYRKYSYETEYQPIATKTFSPLDNSFEDESISVCYNHHLDALGNNIYYYITNNDSTSFSDKKGDNFGDSNFPEWPKLTNLDIEDDNLVLHWKPSASDDIYYYELRRKNSSNTWDPITTYDNYTPTITIAENICGNIDNFPYTIFAYDSCGKSSKLGDLELDSTLQLYPPILESVKYNCNTLTFKWNKNRSLNGEITGCQIQYKLDETAQEIKEIKIPLSDIETTESDYQSYSLKVSEYQEEYPELSNNNSLYFRIRTTAKTTDKQYSSNTCWFGPITIGKIPVAPELFSIVSVKTNTDNSKNRITLNIIDKSTNPISGREYILTRDCGDNNDEKIWSKKDEEIFNILPTYTTTFPDENITNINNSINYKLSVVYKCNNNETLPLGETCFNSIFLKKIVNDTEIKLSWNSISAGSYDNITYNVVRTYNGEVHSEDVQNDTTYTDDLSFIEPNSFKTVKWQVKAINKGINNIDTIAVSNTIKHEISGELQMPNAFIPDSDIPINRFFGPMNNFDENDIKKYRLLIFNNTGTLIWSTEEYSSSNMEISRWNGKDFNGQPCVRGTYIYEVYVELDKSDKPLTARGTVTLIRKN